MANSARCASSLLRTHLRTKCNGRRPRRRFSCPRRYRCFLRSAGRLSSRSAALVAIGIVLLLLLLLLFVKRLLVAGGFSLRRLLLLRLHQPKATKIRRHRFVNRLIMNKQLKTVKFGVVNPSQVANGRRTALFPLGGCLFPLYRCRSSWFRGVMVFQRCSKLLIARLLPVLLTIIPIAQWYQLFFSENTPDRRFFTDFFFTDFPLATADYFIIHFLVTFF